ncbi:MAG: DNA topoisomerase I [Candidatus Bathyarchaeota archaeon]|nr:DNA topoisomerase I [Candidatus Bathyarchaeota archaeon]
MSSRVLVITEKPSSARKIAYALDDDGSPRNAKYGKVTFYVANRGMDELVVVSAVGHLYSIDQVGKGWSYPVFDIKWTPTYRQNKRASYTKQYLDAIIGLGKQMDSYVSACDYDQEGSLIAFNIIKHGIGDKALTKSRRMVYSTLTEKELVYSWQNMSKNLDYPVAAAGKARHEADWLFGINLSRALTIAARRYLDFKKVLSVGRVQGPTLKFVYDNEQGIRSFIPVPYWKIYAETEIDGHVYSLEYEKPRLEREVHAKEVATACRGKTGKAIEVTSEASRTLPPPPFNLGDLQREAYRHHKLNPSATLKAAESLYLGAYISYPRTESNKIPSSIDVKEILGNLAKNPAYESESKMLIQEKRFKSRPGKGDDPAHPAIHPTGQRPRRLKDEEQKVYDLVVRRFLASLGKPLVQLKTDVTVDVNGYIFYLRGVVTQKPGWTTYYERYYSAKDQVIPEITIGQEIPVTKLSTRRQYTRPGSRFNASSLIRKMEQEKIGTKATRSNIVDTLYNRGYIRGQKIAITSLGENTVETLAIYCPEIIDVKLTRDLEDELEEIESGVKDASAVFTDVVDELKPILARFKDNEEQIGRTISNAVLGKPRSDSGSCKLCYRDKVEGSVFCSRHTGAYEMLENVYQHWRYALGLQWVEYLEKVSKTSGTGVYVKEVIQSILG